MGVGACVCVCVGGKRPQDYKKQIKTTAMHGLSRILSPTVQFLKYDMIKNVCHHLYSGNLKEQRVTSRCEDAGSHALPGPCSGVFQTR